MKNVRKSGFMLVETLVVSTFIFSTLIMLYVQFKTINNSYERSFYYNTPNSLYLVNGIKDYLNDGPVKAADSLTAAITSEEFVDFTACDAIYFTDASYCNDLFAKSGVKKAIFTREDVSSLRSYLDTNRIVDEDFFRFINYVKFEGDPAKYRIIISFNDGTFGSLVI